MDQYCLILVSAIGHWFGIGKHTWCFSMACLCLFQFNPVQSLRLILPKDIQLRGNQTTSDALSKQMAYNTTSLLNKLLRGYDNRLRPGFGGPPTIVDVNLNIRSMGPISEKEMAYQMDCYFRQSWVDQRLHFTGPMKILPVSVNILERLWKPDTHFLNGQRSYLHMVSTPNKLLRINQDGRILYSMRLTVKASCPMHLENFPMDTQACPLRFGSHGYDTSDVRYVWTHGILHSIKMAADMRLSQFDLIGYPAGNDSGRHNKAAIWRPGSRGGEGQYSTLSVVFKLRRHMGYFMINVYVPCTLLTIISWVGFWINREATADRIALGITTVLTMCFLGIDNRNDLPKVSYSTALDYFVAVCFLFVLATVFQFAGVHFFTKHGSGEIYHDAESQSEDEDGDEDEEMEKQTYVIKGRHVNGEAMVMLTEAPTSYARRSRRPIPTNHHCCRKFFNCLLGNAIYRQNHSRPTDTGYNSVSLIDKVSRFLFPTSFLVFNICYWSSYLNDEGENTSLS